MYFPAIIAITIIILFFNIMNSAEINLLKSIMTYSNLPFYDGDPDNRTLLEDIKRGDWPYYSSGSVLLFFSLRTI
jgi:hypothetical protein